MVSNAPVSLAKRAANLRQLAEGVQDEDVHQLLTDLADECDVLANAPKPPPEPERRRPGRTEYQHPELIALLRGGFETGEKDSQPASGRSDRWLLRGLILGLILWGLILAGSFFMWFCTALQLI